MKPILGYLAHVASCKLHEVAVGMIRDGDMGRLWFPDCPPRIWTSTRLIDENPVDLDGLALSDVAPRLAEAIDWGRDKWVHVCWLAGMGRS